MRRPETTINLRISFFSVYVSVSVRKRPRIRLGHDYDGEVCVFVLLSRINDYDRFEDERVFIFILYTSRIYIKKKTF